MALISISEQKQIEIGEINFIVRTIKRRFGAVSDVTMQRLYRLTLEQRDDLFAAIYDFTGMDDVEGWLTQNGVLSDREAIVALVSSWEQEGIKIGTAKGIEIGRHEGKVELIIETIGDWFSPLSAGQHERIHQLTDGQLNGLNRAARRFEGLADLDLWLDQHAAIGEEKVKF